MKIMNRIILLALTPVILLVCCNSTSISTDKHGIPEAFAQNGSYSDWTSISKRGSYNLLDKLFNDACEDNDQLNELNDEIKETQQTLYEDSKPMHTFLANNNSYYDYLAAELNNLNDTLLKEALLQVVDGTKSRYEKMEQELDTEILANSSAVQALQDHHTLLKVISTLPIMQKYYENIELNTSKIKQDRKDIKELNKKLDDQLVEYSNAQSS